MLAQHSSLLCFSGIFDRSLIWIKKFGWPNLLNKCSCKIEYSCRLKINVTPNYCKNCTWNLEILVFEILAKWDVELKSTRDLIPKSHWNSGRYFCRPSVNDSHCVCGCRWLFPIVIWRCAGISWPGMRCCSRNLLFVGLGQESGVRTQPWLGWLLGFFHCYLGGTTTSLRALCTMSCTVSIMGA